MSKPQTGISDRSAHADSAGKTVAGCRTMRFSGCGFCMYGSATRILSVCSATSPLSAVNPILLFPIPQPNDPTGQNHPHSSLSFSSTCKVLLPQPLCSENDSFSWGVRVLRTFKPSNLPTFQPAMAYPLSFQTLAHSFAPLKITTLLFSSDSALFAQNNGVG